MVDCTQQHAGVVFGGHKNDTDKNKKTKRPYQEPGKLVTVQKKPLSIINNGVEAQRYLPAGSSSLRGPLQSRSRSTLTGVIILAARVRIMIRMIQALVPGPRLGWTDRERH